MATKFVNFTLPEFVFLDGQGPNGDTLEGRTVVQHIRSSTIIEFFDFNELLISEFHQEYKQRFDYKNSFGLVEKHLAVMWLSNLDFEDIEDMLEKTIEWYKTYLDWEDGNIADEAITTSN